MKNLFIKLTYCAIKDDQRQVIIIHYVVVTVVRTIRLMIKGKSLHMLQVQCLDKKKSKKATAITCYLFRAGI